MSKHFGSRRREAPPEGFGQRRRVRAAPGPPERAKREGKAPTLKESCLRPRRSCAGCRRAPRTPGLPDRCRMSAIDVVISVSGFDRERHEVDRSGISTTGAGRERGGDRRQRQEQRQRSILEANGPELLVPAGRVLVLGVDQ